MMVNAWMPVWTGLLLQALVVLCAFFLPENLDTAHKTSLQSKTRAANGGTEGLSNTPDTAQTYSFDRLSQTILSSLADLCRIFGDWRIAFLAVLNPTRMMTLALEYLQPR